MDKLKAKKYDEHFVEFENERKEVTEAQRNIIALQTEINKIERDITTLKTVANSSKYLTLLDVDTAVMTLKLKKASIATQLVAATQLNLFD